MARDNLDPALAQAQWPVLPCIRIPTSEGGPAAPSTALHHPQLQLFPARAARHPGQRVKFWQPLPPRGFSDAFALVKQKLMKVEGDLHPFMANLPYFKDVIAAPHQENANNGAAR